MKIELGKMLLLLLNASPDSTCIQTHVSIFSAAKAQTLLFSIIFQDATELNLVMAQPYKRSTVKAQVPTKSKKSNSEVTCHLIILLKNLCYFSIY